MPAGLAGAVYEDGRFAQLVGADWYKLPAAIQRRFGTRSGDGGRTVYVGELAYTRLTRLGVLLGQLGRLIGAPLPLERASHLPATVIVTECERIGGQLWTRVYGRQGALPQVIQSAKRFTGPTGCEELVGRGIGMRLSVLVQQRALVFRSTAYFLRLGARSLTLPGWLTPGVIEVVHREERAGQFSFSLSVTHPLAGKIVDQLALFREGMRL